MDTIKVIYKILKSYWDEEIEPFIKIWFKGYDRVKIKKLPEPQVEIVSIESTKQKKYEPYDGPYCETP